MKSFITNKEIQLRSTLDFRRDFVYEEAVNGRILFDHILDKDSSIYGETYNFSQEQDFSIQSYILFLN